jgi:hypothetical protein
MSSHAGELAHALVPALVAACEGRLERIEWFSSTGQRGGAATATGVWRSDAGDKPVFIKLPVDPTEYRWTSALSRAHADAPRVTPVVLAGGEELGGHDLAWLVCERLDTPHTPTRLGEAGVRAVLHSCVLMQQAAEAQCSPMSLPTPVLPDWERALARGREACKSGEVPDGPRWVQLIHWVQRHLPAMTALWRSRPINSWCHGDLHPGNVMCRPGDALCGAQGPARVLVDLGLFHAGHWIEDALYFERQYWGHKHLLFGIKPVTFVANDRRQRGLVSGGDYGRLANVRRVLAAACAPALIEREGNPAYLAAALDIGESLAPQLRV